LSATVKPSTVGLSLTVERDSGDVTRYGIHFSAARVAEITATVVRGKRGAAHGITYSAYMADNSHAGVRTSLESALRLVAEWLHGDGHA